MADQSMKNLAAAFAGESQANRRYLAWAEKADQEGKPNAARLFRFFTPASIRPGRTSEIRKWRGACLSGRIPASSARPGFRDERTVQAYPGGVFLWVLYLYEQRKYHPVGSEGEDKGKK